MTFWYQPFSKKKHFVTSSHSIPNPFVFSSDYLFSHCLTSRVTSLVKVNGDDSATMLSMVAAEMGVTVLPSLALANAPEGVCLLDMDPPGKQMLGAALPNDARKIDLGPSRVVSFVLRPRPFIFFLDQADIAAFADEAGRCSMFLCSLLSPNLSLSD